MTVPCARRARRARAEGRAELSEVAMSSSNPSREAPPVPRPSRLPGTGAWRARSWLLVVLACSIGVALGVGLYTFRFAEGLSYFSPDPVACVNCHIMRPQYAAWQHSSHHTVAVCIDCHLPHEFVPK